MGTNTIEIRRMTRSMVPQANSKKVDAHWISMMKKFSEANKEKCKVTHSDELITQKIKKTFPTDSMYDGSMNVLGMNGYGTYYFPYKGERGVRYQGGFKDGTFHGNGVTRYYNGVRIKGKWNRGHLADLTVVFADNLEYSEENWGYCVFPDRRFTIEYKKGLNPSGNSFMTAQQPAPEIPHGYYDVGDGLYDPNTHTVRKYDDLIGIVRSPYPREQLWIQARCRTNPLLPIGPANNLYEKWLTPELKSERPPLPAGFPKPEECQDPFITEESKTGRSREESRLYATKYNAWSKYDEDDKLFWDPNQFDKSRRSITKSGRSSSLKIKFSRQNTIIDASSFTNVSSQERRTSRAIGVESTYSPSSDGIKARLE